MSNDKLCKCADCGHVCPESELVDIENFYARHFPGDTVANGQCPKCGALSFETDAEPMRCADGMRSLTDALTSVRASVCDALPVAQAKPAKLDIDSALWHLRCARNTLYMLNCPRALAKVRRALKSAEGAKRNLSVRAYRAI